MNADFHEKEKCHNFKDSLFVSGAWLAMGSGHYIFLAHPLPTPPPSPPPGGFRSVDNDMPTDRAIIRFIYDVFVIDFIYFHHLFQNMSI